MAQVKNIVRSQIIPLTGINLVLPNTSIAEIINYSEPAPVDNAPGWFLGMVEWRGIMIPVISFEKANDIKASKKSKNTRIAVLNGLSGNDNLSFYGVIVQGIPRLASLDENSVQVINEPSMELPFALSQAEIAETEAAIPDQLKLEKLLANAGAMVAKVV